MTIAERSSVETSNANTAASEAWQQAVARSIELVKAPRADRYVVSVDEYVSFRRDGFVHIRGLYTAEEVRELREHTEDLMQGRLPEQQASVELDADRKPKKGVDMQGLAKPSDHLTPEQKADFWLRVHMLHRQLAIHEKHLLHPRVLDVLESLIGPDVLAMQTMLFLKGPGKPGQGFHQDSYYIPTYPDSLCGAWVAIDEVDEENGCMYFTPGSGNEPIYPPADGYGYGDGALKDIQQVTGISDTDDSKNDLYGIWKKKYNHEVPLIMKPGDVAFFNGHVLHRSHTNRSATRFRRSFVGHYCNARAYTDWGSKEPTVTPDPMTGSTNGSHILARGDTHMPFAYPKFLTPCAALVPAEIRKMHRRPGASMMGMPSGQMGLGTHGTDADHDKAHAAGTKAK